MVRPKKPDYAIIKGVYVQGHNAELVVFAAGKKRLHFESIEVLQEVFKEHVFQRQLTLPEGVILNLKSSCQVRAHVFPDNILLPEEKTVRFAKWSETATAKIFSY